MSTPAKPDPNEPLPPPATLPTFPEQNEYGIDLSLIRQNLRLTPTERLRRASRFMRGMKRIRQHARRIK